MLRSRGCCHKRSPFISHILAYPSATRLILNYYGLPAGICICIKMNDNTLSVLQSLGSLTQWAVKCVWDQTIVQCFNLSCQELMRAVNGIHHTREAVPLVSVEMWVKLSNSSGNTTLVWAGRECRLVLRSLWIESSGETKGYIGELIKPALLWVLRIILILPVYLHS